jgi:hypothetical protein
MFYNHDYLTSKKAGLRIVWRVCLFQPCAQLAFTDLVIQSMNRLASTLGQSSKKLSKREIVAVDVTKTW